MSNENKKKQPTKEEIKKKRVMNDQLRVRREKLQELYDEALIHLVHALKEQPSLKISTKSMVTKVRKSLKNKNYQSLLLVE